MILAILLCLLIAATPLAYAVYRAYKLAEVERLCRRQWPSIILGEHGPELLSGETMAGLDTLTQAIAVSKVSIVPPDASAIVQQIGKAEPVGWFDSAGYYHEAYQPQPDYEEIQATYPTDWKPGE